MAQFTTLTSRLVALPVSNVDTDQIIPARYLKVTDKAGLGAALAHGVAAFLRSYLLRRGFLDGPAVARLRHHHIVQVHDIGAPNGRVEDAQELDPRHAEADAHEWRRDHVDEAGVRLGARFTPATGPLQAGHYTVTVSAFDVATNQSITENWSFTVLAPVYQVYLPMVKR